MFYLNGLPSKYDAYTKTWFPQFTTIYKITIVDRSDDIKYFYMYSHLGFVMSMMISRGIRPLLAKRNVNYRYMCSCLSAAQCAF